MSLNDSKRPVILTGFNDKKESIMISTADYLDGVLLKGEQMRLLKRPGQINLKQNDTEMKDKQSSPGNGKKTSEFSSDELEKAVNKLVADAIKDGKIDKKGATSFRILAKSNYDSAVEYLDGIRPGNLFLLPIEHLEYDELFKSGEGLEILKKYLPERFREVYFKKFGKYPKD